MDKSREERKKFAKKQRAAKTLEMYPAWKVPDIVSFSQYNLFHTFVN